MSYHFFSHQNQPLHVVEWERITPPAQPVLGAVGDFTFRHDWRRQVTEGGATGWSEKAIAVGLVGVVAVVAYKKLS